ncbi:MAG TPA: CofH family radical SAM protein [Planctomycetota bacterium]|nr:CofH family radical SAM protein [Planctomycetota bacterium]
MDPKIILETARQREEISAIEALMLMQEGDAILPDLLETADLLNRRLHGGAVTYVRSKKIHYTNVCRAECRFCPFWRKKGARGAFSLSVIDVIRQIREAQPIRQVELQGGLNPDLTLPYFVELLRGIKSEYPNLHVHGFSPSEIHFIARRSRTTPFDVLKRLKSAGLDSLSGDSADILNDKLRKKLAPDKLRTNDWIDILRTAHRLGLPTTASILFGHIEDEIQFSEHLDIVKNLQRETGGIVAFEPIPYLPAGTDLSHDRRYHPGSVERLLKSIAIIRIFYARTIRTIQLSWAKVGLATLLRGLDAGVNDLGALSVDPNEIRSPEVNGKLTLPASVLRSMIQKAGRNPVEREPGSARSITRVKPRIEEPVLV